MKRLATHYSPTMTGNRTHCGVRWINGVYCEPEWPKVTCGRCIKRRQKPEGDAP